MLTHLDDTDYLAQMEAVTRFMSNMTAYPGRTFGQLYHRFVKGNALAQGRMEIGDRTIDLAAITVPVLVFAGNTDGIAPLPAVRAVVPLLTGSRAGALRGGARRPPRHAHRPRRPRHDVGGHRRVGRRVVRPGTLPARKAGRKRREEGPGGEEDRRQEDRGEEGRGQEDGAKKTAAKKAAAKKAASPGTIGSNPTRRYGSSGSRALGPR